MAKTVRVEIVLDEGEPYWILRGNSPLSPQLTQIWAACAKLIDANAHEEKIKDAYRVAAQMREYLKAHHREEFPILAAIEHSLTHGGEDESKIDLSQSKEVH